MEHTNDIAIVGMAALFPGARDVDELWSNIVNGVDAITEPPPGRWPGVPPGETITVGGLELPLRGGFVPTPIRFDALRHRVMPSAAVSPTFDQFVLIDLVDRALADAGVKPDDAVRAETDLVVGRGGYPSAGVAQSMSQAEGIEWFMRYLAVNVPDLAPSDRDAIEADIRERVGGDSPEAVEATVPNFVASRTANRLDLRGASYVIDAACASSLIAVEHVVDRLRAGRASLGVAAGVNFFQYPAFWWMLGKLGAVSPTGRSRPFDTDADGIVLAEGAGVVVLKRLDDAVSDGNEVYAVIKGVGSSSDGRGTGLLAPSSEGQRQALERAYSDANVSPDTIGLLEAHGTGTRIGDLAEARTIREIFGARSGVHPRRPMASLKSMIGHSVPAAGIASLIKTALALRDKVVPPSLGVTSPIEALADTDFYVNPEIRPWIHPVTASPRRAAISAFGFGGVNSHVILEEVDRGRPVSRSRGSASLTGPLARTAVSVVTRPTELVLATAASREALEGELRHVLEAASGTDVTAEWVAAEMARRADTTLPWRLVAVRPADGFFADVADIADRLHGGGDLDELGVRISRPEVTDGSVAALLGGSAPGLQSDLPDQQLVKALHLPSFRYVLDVVEPGTGRADDPYPVSFHLRPPPGTSADDRRRFHDRFSLGEADENTPPSEWPLLQSVMPAIKYGAWLAVSDLSISVDRLVAISSGEVTALCAAGIVDFEEMMAMLADLFSDERYIGFPWSTITSGFIFATPEQLGPYLKRYPEVQISMYLGENMVTLCGLSDSFDALRRELREEGLVVAEMPLAGIHSTHLDPIAEALVSDVFSRFELSEPRLPIWAATVEGEVEGSAADIVALAAECVRRPLYLWQMIRRLPDEGVDTVVELGPTPHHAQFVSEAPEDVEVHGLVTEVAKVHPITQLQNLVAELLVLGKKVDPTGLFVGRQPRPPHPVEPTEREIELSTAWEPLGSPDLEPVRWRDRRSAPVRRPERPLVGRVTAETDGRRLRHTLRFDLDVDTHVVDHTFVANDGRPAELRFPVVALTVLLEAMAETALESTCALGVRRVRDLKVTRWVQLDGVRQLDVDVEAEVAGPDPDDPHGTAVEVTISVGGTTHGTATIVVGDPPQDASGPFIVPAHADDVRAGVTPDAIYSGRLFFHGQAFQCLHAIDAVSSAGVSGRLVVRDPREMFRFGEVPTLALDPVVLDGVGQLIATWFLGTDHKMLPTMISDIEVLGPTPPPGTVVEVSAVPRVVDPEAYFTVFDAEVGDGTGHVWMRITGFRDWVFTEDPLLSALRHSPSTAMTATPLSLAGLPGDVTVTVMPRFALNDLQTKVLPRIALHPDEIRRHDAIGDKRRRVDFALGRLALKDAVRVAMGRPVFPHTVRAGLVDGRGLEVEVPGYDTRLCGSVSHGPAGVCAVLSPRRVGIDLESFAAVAAVDPTSFCSDDESALGVDLVDVTAWRAAVWVAKEAAAKLSGDGLGGRPSRWTVEGFDPKGWTADVVDADTGVIATVHLTWFGESVLGVAVE